MEAATKRMARGALLRCARRSVRRWSLVAGIGLVAALATPGAAGATSSPSPSFQDSAVGSGSTPVFSSFNFNVTSGASGENPSGFTTTDGFGQHFEGTSITCLSVTGNTATFVAPLAPNVFGFTYGKVTAVDDGPAGFAALKLADGPQPQRQRPNATALAAAEYIRTVVLLPLSS